MKTWHKQQFPNVHFICSITAFNRIPQTKVYKKSSDPKYKKYLTRDNNVNVVFVFFSFSPYKI